jgi:hypothetical protein
MKFILPFIHFKKIPTLALTLNCYKSMTWYPLGPDFVAQPRQYDFTRLSFRNTWGNGGRIHHVAFESGTPAEPATIYAIVNDTVGGFVCLFRKRTTDVIWKSLTDGLRNADTNADPSAVAVNPHFPATIYMGMWNSSRIYRSGDRGDTWDAPVMLPGKVKKIVVDPRPPASLSQTVVYAATTEGLMRSADNGGSWALVLNGSIDSFVLFWQGGSYHAYAGVRGTGLFYANADPVAPGTWTNLSTASIGLPAPDGMPLGFDRILVDACASNPTFAYAWISRPGYAGGPTETTVGLYKTQSPGTAWTTVSLAPTSTGGTALNPYQSGMHYCFAVSPDSPGNGINDVLFFGGLSLHRSHNSGTNWTEQAIGFHPDYMNVAFYPVMPVAPARSALYICTDGGIASSPTLTNPAVDFGVAPPTIQFNHLETITPDSPYFTNRTVGIENPIVFGINKNIKNLPLIATWDNGVYMKDGAKGWSRVSNGFDGIQVSELTTPTGNVVLYSLMDTYYGINTTSGTLNEGPEIFSSPVSIHEEGTGFSVYGTSNFATDRFGKTIVGCTTVHIITTTTTLQTAGSGPRTVTVVTTAGLTNGSYIRVGEWGGSSISDVTPTSFTYLAPLVSDLPIGAPVYVFRPVVMAIHPDLRARRISQIFDAPSTPANAVKLIGYGGTGIERRFAAMVPASDGSQNQILHRMDESGMVGGVGTMMPVTMGQPNLNLPAYLYVARNRDIWVIYAVPVMSGGVTTPFFRIPAASDSWEAQNVASLPAVTFPNGTSHPFGPFVEDPIVNNRFYFSQGGAVFQLNPQADPNSWTSVSIQDNYPGATVMQLEAGVVSPDGAPVVKLLRAATAGRGVWEMVLPGSAPSVPLFFVRRHILDQGWSRNIEQGMPHPWVNGANVWHWESEDIKWEVPVSGSGVYYATDPMASGENYYVPTVPPPAVLPPPPPINHIQFHLLRQHGQTIRPSTRLRLHAQVQARSLTPTGNVNVWLLYAPCGSALPLLNERTDGSTFNFWGMFLPDGSVNHASLDVNSKWKSAGPPRSISGISINNPGIASWYWDTPATQGHYCMVMLVHGPGVLIGESSRHSIDEIVMDNPQVGQRNLNLEAMPMGAMMMSMMMAGGSTSGSSSLEWMRHNWPGKGTLQLQFPRLPGGISALTALKGTTKVIPGGLFPTLGWTFSNLWDKVARAFGGRKTKTPPIHPRKFIAQGDRPLRLDGIEWGKEKNLAVQMAVKFEKDEKINGEVTLVAIQYNNQKVAGGVTYRFYPETMERQKPMRDEEFRNEEEGKNEAIERGEMPGITLLRNGNAE